MATSGDWVTPRLYGQPWFEKPILYYWLAAAGFLLHLPAEYAARLPSAFAALAAAVSIGWLGFKYYPVVRNPKAAPALLAPLIFSCSVGGIGFARAATPDMLFSASVTLAMASAAAILSGHGRFGAPRTVPEEAAQSSFAVILFGVFLGLGVLAKGPAAVLLAGGALILWVAATRQWRDILLFLNPFGIVAFCLITLPWYVLCALRNPDFLHVFIFQHNFERYLTPLFQHRQPFWFFIPITILAVIPWAMLLWPAIKLGLNGWRQAAATQSPSFFFACWAVFPVLFFSLSQSKLPSYILPSVPALCLILAATLSHLLNDNSQASKNLRKIVGVGIGSTWVVLGIATLIWRHRLSSTMRQDAGRAVLTLGLIALIAGCVIAFLSARKRQISVWCSIVLAVVLLEGTSFYVLPALDPYFSARWHGQFLRNDAYPDRLFTYHLQRSWNYGLAFYLGRELPEWSPEHKESALVLTTPAGLREMQKLGRVSGTIEEPDKGVLYVPAYPAPF
jgi:4-amino-4-deoxy-L-arabinose transferase-like glycosyltransferase